MEYKFPFNTTKKHLQKQDMKQDQEEQKIVEEGDQGTSKEWESVSNISDVDEEDAGGVIEQIYASNSSVFRDKKTAAY